MTQTEVQLDKDQREVIKSKIKDLSNERMSIIEVANYLQCYKHLARPMVE